MTVALVGAGPGDPGLVTVRGLELLGGCDAVVYDRLVAPELVDETPDDALRIPRDGIGQDQINELLVALGRQGLDVVRLNGGDPYLFGRGGEEALALAEAGVRFEVVPGVSSVAAVPAAASIPVTHRGVADTVTIVGMADDPGAEIARLAREVRALRDAELALHVSVVGDTVAPFMTAPDTDPAALRAIDSLAILPADPAAASEEIERRREEIGFSYFVFGAGSADTLAPVVAALAGR